MPPTKRRAKQTKTAKQMLAEKQAKLTAPDTVIHNDPLPPPRPLTPDHFEEGWRWPSSDPLIRIASIVVLALFGIGAAILLFF